jgi:primary-amine oxidase
VAFRTRSGPRPDRKAFAIVITSASSVAEVVVNISKTQIEVWKAVEEVSPTLTLEDLDVMERVARNDRRVIQACQELGITDMSKGT